MPDTKKNSSKERIDLSNLKQAMNDAGRFGTGAYVAETLEATQIHKFGTKGGTGFAAEDAHALHDRLSGIKVEQVGKDNAKNGADRLVNGKPIQTKYFDTARATVNDAFDKNGLFRYEGMELEVPKDQYEKAIVAMKEKIEAGKVPGVTDPELASTIIKQGHVTYEQARNIARAGNLDSLRYDAANAVVVSTCTFGISFAINFGLALWHGEKPTAALKQACKLGGLGFVRTMLTSVVTAQVLRTQAARTSTIYVRGAIKALYDSTLGKSVIDRVASASVGKKIAGAAAQNNVAKLVRTNLITGTIVTLGMSLPDTWRACSKGDISWAQVAKNCAVNGVGVGAGSVGWAGGAVAGAAVGTVCPPLIPVTTFLGALLGSIAIGNTASYLAKQGLDFIRPDDALQMLHLLEADTIALCEDYLLDAEEQTALVKHIYSRCDEALMRAMYGSPDRRRFVREKFEQACKRLVAGRARVIMPSDVKVRNMLAAILAEIALEEAKAASVNYVPDFVVIGGVAACHLQACVSD